MPAFLDSFTRSTPSGRKKLLRYFADSLPENHQLAVYEVQSKIYAAEHKKNPGISRHELALGSLIVAIAMYKRKEESLSSKDTSPEAVELIARLHRDRLVALRKTKESKYRKVIEARFFGEIKQLRDSGISWRNIAEHISKVRKRKISHSHLRKLYMEIVDDRNHFDTIDTHPCPRMVEAEDECLYLESE